MYAATFDHLETVKLLLATKTVNINQQENKGWSALMMAAGKGHFKVVEFLIEKVANVNE